MDISNLFRRFNYSVATLVTCVAELRVLLTNTTGLVKIVNMLIAAQCDADAT